MPKLLSSLLAGLALTFALSVPASAQSKVVVQRSAKPPKALWLSTYLKPSHTYQVQFHAPSKENFLGQAMQRYTYVRGKALGTGSKFLKMTGITPRTYKITAPSSGIRGWVLVMNAQGFGTVKLTVKLVDLGKHK